MKHGRLVALLVLVVAALSACDPIAHAGPRKSSPKRVEVDLRAIHRTTTAGVQETCVSVIHEAVLRVGGRERMRQPVPPGAASIRFDSVEVEVGRVTFAVEVLNRTGQILYAGQAQQEIDPNGFEVPVTVEKRNAVLQVCPAQITLDADNGFHASVTVTNRGNRTLLPYVLGPATACGALPCLVIGALADSLAPGESRAVSLDSRYTGPQALTLRVGSNSGDVDVAVRTAENRPPRFTSQPEVTARVGQQFSYTVEAEDPEGLELTLDAPELARWLDFTDQGDGTALLSGTPPSAGSYPVVLTASDGVSSVEQRITLVVAANRPPVVIQQLPETVDLFRGESFDVDLASYFQDPDGDPLLAAPPVVGNPEVVEVSVEDDQLSMLALDLGSSRVEVIVEDELGGRISATTVVNVLNRAPELVEQLPDTVEVVVGEGLEIDLADYFADLDEDSLNFPDPVVVDGDEELVELWMDGSVLVVIGLEEGSVTVAVTAEDPYRASARAVFVVTVVPADLASSQADPTGPIHGWRSVVDSPAARGLGVFAGHAIGADAVR